VRVSRTTVAVVGVAAVCLAPVALLAYFVWDTPAYRLYLYETRWNVATVNGVTVTDPPSISFGDPGSYTTPCGEVPLSYDGDTDGSTLFVWEEQPSSCDLMTAAQRAVFTAVLNTEEWAYHDDAHITLIGPSSSVELTR
jgi:hypothetical protein